VWDAATGKPVTPPLQHHSRPYNRFNDLGEAQACFSADGKFVAAIIEQQGHCNARVWDVRGGEPVTPVVRLRGVPTEVAFGPKDRAVIGVANAARSRADVWEVTADDRPAADLLLHARLLSGHHIDATGALAPVEAKALRAAWRTLHDRYPADFTLPPEQVLAWHRRQAEACGTERTKQWWSAAFHWGRLIAAEPGDPSLWGNRGRSLAQLGLHGAAVSDLSRAVAVKPEPWALRLRGLSHAAVGEHRLAVADFTQALGLDGKDSVALQLRAEAFTELGDWPKVVDDCTQLLKLDPKNKAALPLRAAAHARLKEWEKAYADYTDALKVSATWRLRLGRSQVQYERGKKDEAARDLIEALEPAPLTEAIALADWQRAAVLKEVDRLGKLKPKEDKDDLDTSEGLELRARLLFRLGQWDRAVAAYDDVFELRGFIGAMSGLKGELWLEWLAARAKLPGGEQAVAITRLLPSDTQAVAIARLLPPAPRVGNLHPLGMVKTPRQAMLRLGAGDLEGYRRLCANAEFDRLGAAVLAPNAVKDYAPLYKDVESLGLRKKPRLLGALHYRAGKLEEAREHLHEALSWGDADDAGWTCVFLAMTYHRLQQPAEARRWLDRARDHHERLAGKIRVPMELFSEGEVTDLGMWWAWLELELLRREATALIEGGAKPGP
jgi:tetratricopeptide (TPR) repeat protein